LVNIADILISSNYLRKAWRRVELFYIRLENQIHLLIVLIFSAYIYLSSLAVKDEPFFKNLGTSFLSSLILGIMSFLSLNTLLAESYIFFSEFVLVTALFIVLAAKRNRDLNTIVFILLYVFPLVIAVLSPNTDSLHRHMAVKTSLFAYTGLILAIIVISIVKKKYSLLVIYSGIFSICASLLIPGIISQSRAAVIVSLILKTAGYMFFTYFFSKSSVLRPEISRQEIQQKFSDSGKSQ